MAIYKNSPAIKLWPKRKVLQPYLVKSINILKFQWDSFYMLPLLFST